MTAPHLFPPGPATGNLTDNQQLVLDLLKANPQGMYASDIGRVLHLEGSYKCRTCNDKVICKWAMTNALSVLRTLSTPTEANPRGRGLAIHRKTGLWQSTAPVPVSERDTGELPEGF